jgi:hypothetical protein
MKSSINETRDKIACMLQSSVPPNDASAYETSSELVLAWWRTSDNEERRTLEDALTRLAAAYVGREITAPWVDELVKVLRVVRPPQLVSALIEHFVATKAEPEALTRMRSWLELLSRYRPQTSDAVRKWLKALPHIPHLAMTALVDHPEIALEELPKYIGALAVEERTLLVPAILGKIYDANPGRHELILNTLSAFPSEGAVRPFVDQWFARMHIPVPNNKSLRPRSMPTTPRVKVFPHRPVKAAAIVRRSRSQAGA